MKETTSSSRDTLLPEIWLLILSYLKPNDLRSLTLVDTKFLRLSQPPLFTVLDVSPFLRTYNEHPIRRPREYLARFMDRLAYYKQPHIVHAVQQCWISPYTRAGFPQRDERDDLDPRLVIDKVLEVLHEFPNLMSVSWHCIDLTPRWWGVLSRLRLKRLWINSSSFVGFGEADSEEDLGGGEGDIDSEGHADSNDKVVPSPSYPKTLEHVERLDLDQWPWEGNITNQVSIHESNSAGVDLEVLRYIIQPDVIQTITVPRVNTAARLFEILSAFAPPEVFGVLPASMEPTGTRLRTLKMPYSAIRDVNLVPAFKACAGLQMLCVFPPTSDERFKVRKADSAIAGLLPDLRAYEGPYHLLPLFGTRRQGVVEKLSLWGLDERPAFANPDAVAESLSSLVSNASGRGGLKELRLLVTRISSDLLDVLHTFQELESLEMHSQDSPTNRELFLSHPVRTKAPILALYALILRTEFPKSLKYLTLHTRLSSTPYSSRHSPPPQSTSKDTDGITSHIDKISITSSQERAAAEFMEGLAKSCPSLQRAEVNYGIYWTGMVTAVWGRVRWNNDYQPPRGWKVLKKRINSDNTKVLDTAHRQGSHAAWDPANSDAQRPDCSRTPSSISIPDTVGSDDSDDDDDLSLSRPVTPRKIKEGYSSKSSSKDYILSTVVSSVHPLPLGKLTFTEHRRTILLQEDSGPGGAMVGSSAFAPSIGGSGAMGALGRDQEGRFSFDWTMTIWMRVRRFIGLD